MTKPNILLCTVGTSLFQPNLEGLKAALDGGVLPDDRRRLAEAYTAGDWATVALALSEFPSEDRLCGAEINSIASLIAKDYVPADCGLFFLHSDTDNGQAIATILRDYFQLRGHAPVEAVRVGDLQDSDPRRFRTRGLRNLAREICGIIRQRSAAACAINATGGYKAQIAVAVLLGQALSVPVYYKHERFSEIIAFPPMPVALDFEVWMKASGMLFDLERSSEPVRAEVYLDDWDEKYENLVERVRIDGIDYLELSPTGQIFHETFRERFRKHRAEVLPPAADNKRPPHLEKAGWPSDHPEVERFLRRVTEDLPPVVQCATFYFNPDLPERTRFLLSRESIVGVFSPREYTVKFRVETTAETPTQMTAMVAALNQWLAESNQ